MRVLFALGSILILILILGMVYQEINPPWKDYQREFLKFASSQARNEAERQTYRESGFKINQIYIPELNTVDRCTTCHLGLDNPDFEKAKNPYKTHPTDYLENHPPEKFGCTVCHQGQGYATNLPAAHGEVKHWEEPLLKGILIQSSCGKCHRRENLSEAPILAKGEKLIADYGCQGCHKIEEFPERGRVATDLTGIASKARRGWIVRWLKDPRNYLDKPKMPDFKLKDDEVDALTEYLMTLRYEKFVENNKIDEAGMPSKDEVLLKEGETIFRESRCISCHPVDGKGGHIWSDLGKIGSKVRKEWLYAWLKNPRAYQVDTKMPEFNFSNRQIYALSSYILDELADFQNPIGENPQELKMPIDLDKVKKGTRLFSDFGCSGCHYVKGLEGAVKVGPDLTKIGNKPVESLDFGKIRVIKQTLPDWLFNKLKDPRIFGKNLKMPNYGFSDEEALETITVLLSLRGIELPEKYIIKKEKEFFYEPQGKVGALFKKYKCLSCHKIFGVGGTIAPDLTIEGSTVYRNWLEKYFKVPYSLRPTHEERMLDLKMSDEEIKTLTDYISMVLVNDEIPVDFLKEEKDLKTLAEQGKKLFEGKYNCKSCHIVGPSGGYVGPPLSNVGSRLNPGYIFKWLKNPQKYVPDVIEPNFGLTDDEAKAITSYLMILK